MSILRDTPPADPPPDGPEAADPGLPFFLGEEDEDRRTLRKALLVATFLHLVLLVVTFPEISARPRWIAPGAKAFVVQNVRYKPPPPQMKAEAPKPERKKKKIPVPDPTPDDPEPIVLPDPEDVDVELPDVDAVFGIPEAPPGNVGPGAAPVWVDGNVQPPVKVYAPQPLYTEDARKARVQGVVILQAVIDAVGNVADIKVLKGLPLGLTESAQETVAQWRFQPATLNGEPVPVYFNLTVSFSIQ